MTPFSGWALRSNPFRVPWVFTILLVGFVFCYTVGPRVPELVVVAECLGVAMAVCVVIRWIKTGIQIPLEIGILFLFVVWAVGAGGLLATDWALYAEGVERMVEILLLAGCVAAMAAKCRTPAIGLLAITGLALILAAYSLMTGDFGRAEEFTREGDRIIGYRASSLAYNPNTLGVSSVWGLAGLAWLWQKAKRVWQRALLIGAGLLLVAGAVYSGSLKAVVLVPLFLLAWVWFCYRQLLVRRVAVFLSVGAVAAAIIVGASFVLRDTYAGARLQAVVAADITDPSTQLRLSMIQEGLQMIREHPLTGVGLYQFAALSSHQTYAHNDYVEVAATTGLVGLAIYCSLFAVIAWRLIRIRRGCRSSEAHYAAGLSLAVLVTCVVAGFARVTCYDIEFWCFISGVMGFASIARRSAGKRLVWPSQNCGIRQTRGAVRGSPSGARSMPSARGPAMVRRARFRGLHGLSVTRANTR